jgi:hypothetical protein
MRNPFLATMRDLSDRGAEAFLTTALEEELISFTTFLRKSLKATEVVRTAVLEMGLSVPLIGASLTTRKELVGLPADWAGDLNLNVPGVKMTSRVEKLVAAPLLSEAFEQRMVADLTRLKAFIKEVTLGAHYGPPV